MSLVLTACLILPGICSDELGLEERAEALVRRWTTIKLPVEHRGIDRTEGVERWRPLVAEHFPNQTDRALCIMEHESRGNPNAKNPNSSARGLFQILASLWAPHFNVSYQQLYDPETNVRLAREIYDMQGWRAWSPYKRGECR